MPPTSLPLATWQPSPGHFWADTPTLNREAVGKLSSELLSALALDPRDGVVLDNLDRLYRLFETRPALSPFPPADLASRLSAVKVARKGAAP